MSDDGRRQERVARATRVRLLIEDGEIGLVFDDVKAELVQTLLTCRDEQERNRLWHSIDGLERVRTRFFGLASGEPGERAAIAKGR